MDPRAAAIQRSNEQGADSRDVFCERDVKVRYLPVCFIVGFRLPSLREVARSQAFPVSPTARHWCHNNLVATSNGPERVFDRPARVLDSHIAAS